MQLTQQTQRTESSIKRQQPTANSQPKVVAAIPCFNTEPFIADVVSKAKKYVDQVIVVDDGSYDGTSEAAREAGASVISHEANRGKGAAMKTAAQAVGGAQLIVFLDGDGQHACENIPRLIAPIVWNRADFVIGSRCLPESAVSGSPFTRRITNYIASLVISVVISFLLPVVTFLNALTHPTCRAQKTEGTGQTQMITNEQLLTADCRLLTGRLKWITDCTSGFRAVRKEAWQNLDLASRGFQIETEMIYEAARNGLTIAEVPVSCNWSGKVSRLSILKDGLRTLKLLWAKLVGDIRGR